MRIISGKHKGRRLVAPKKLPVRPTTDQAKEGLFNILWNRYDFDELSVLDLFSGTGNMSYEFSSRGVPDILAVDAFYGCIKYIQKTAAELEMAIQTHKSDVFQFLNRPATRQFSIIFADPPYGFSDEEFKKIAELVFENNWLKPGGTLIIEHSKHSKLTTAAHNVEERQYGGSVFSFFQHN